MNTFSEHKSWPRLVALGNTYLLVLLGQAALAGPTHLPDRSNYEAPQAADAPTVDGLAADAAWA